MLLLAWLVAVLIRLATGSATVATVTASGILAPLVAGMSTGRGRRCWSSPSVPARCSSPTSTTPGFWLVKEYFGLSVGQTIKTWSLMETVISVTGLVFVLVLDVFFLRSRSVRATNRSLRFHELHEPGAGREPYRAS